MDKEFDYRWETLETSGAAPPIRLNSASAYYREHIWLFLGLGVGRTSEVWRFSFATKAWSLCPCKGDIPTPRDGHTVTYVGRGKFILFGGQGKPYENDKSEKFTDTVAIKTYLVRELYNSMYQLDVDAEGGPTWTRFEEDGAGPMGRRGHTINYKAWSGSMGGKNGRMSMDASITGSSSSLASSYGEGGTGDNGGGMARSSRERSPGSRGSRVKVIQNNEIPPRSLILFGGSGIESSKYTEVLFNDLWVYNIDKRHWSRHYPTGTTPKPMFDHRAELVGENLIIVGGLTIAPKLQSQQQKVSSSRHMTDVAILNTTTLSWTYLDLYDQRGRTAKFRLHGFSMCPELPSHGKDPRDVSSLIIFGGKDTSYDGSRAPPADSTSGSSQAGMLSSYASSASVSSLASNKKKRRTAAPTHVWRLDLDRGIVVPLKNKYGVCPPSRYGHVGIAMTPLEIIFDEKDNGNKLEERDDPKKGNSGTKTKGAPVIYPAKGQDKKKVDPPEPLLFIYGGCGTETGGLIDPTLHQLVRAKPVEQNFLDTLLQGLSSGSVNGDEGSRPTTAGSHRSGGSIGDNTLPMSIRGSSTHSDDDNDDEDDEFSPSRVSIWNKKHGQEKNPKDWTELRLALSYSVSEKRSLTHDDSHGSGGEKDHLASDSRFQQSTLASSTLVTSAMNASLAANTLLGSSSGLGNNSIFNSSSNNNNSRQFPKLKDSIMNNSASLLMGSKSAMELSLTDRPSSGLPKSGKPMTKLEEMRYKAAKIKSLGEKIKPMTTGKSYIKAKEAYMSLFPHKI